MPDRMAPRAARWVCAHTWLDLGYAVNLRSDDGRHTTYDELRVDGHRVVYVAFVSPVLPDHHVTPRRRAGWVQDQLDG